MKLKKIIALLLLATVFTSAASCNGSTSIKSVSALDLVKASVAGYETVEIPDSLLFVYGAADDSANYLDPDTAGLYFKGVFGADMSALNLLDDYAIHIPNTKRVFEIDIFVAHSDDELTAAKELLENRLAQKNH